MDNLIKDIEVVDEIGKAADMAIDIMCLSQEIRNEFFSPRFKTEHEQQVFVWHVYERATSLFRILDNLIFDLSNILTILDKSLNERTLESNNTTQDNTESENKSKNGWYCADCGSFIFSSGSVGSLFVYWVFEEK